MSSQIPPPSPAPPPPPPPAPKPTTIGRLLRKPTSSGDENKCYEIVKLSYDESIQQVVDTVAAELDGINGSQMESEGVGLLVILNPILEPILQCGPVCGLIALVEAAHILDKKLTPDFILEEAIRLNMTKKGEMFSVQDMQRLVKEYVDCDATIVDTMDVEATEKLLIDNILQGNPALIPYDADHNHSPSQRKGHAAHWAMIHGMVFPLPLPLAKFFDAIPNQIYLDSCDNKGRHHTLHPNSLIVLNPMKQTPTVLDFISQLLKAMNMNMKSKTYVLAHQGKSIRTALWKCDELIRSNQNLLEISPMLTSTPEEYVLNDILSGLRSKLLLLKKFPTA